MALTKRQEKFYTDTVSIWKKPGDTGTLPKDGNNVVTNLIYTASATETGVVCMLQTALEANQYRRPLGRTEMDNMWTLDKLFLEVDNDLEDQDYVQLTTEGHPLKDQWFIVQGEGRVREIRAGRKGNYLMVQLKRTNDPPQQGA